MKQTRARLLAMVLLAGAVIGAACEGESNGTAEQAQDRASTTASDLRERAADAWAGLRTDGERLIDDVQTRNDPEAKDQLLDHCRDAEEQLREADSANADRVNEFCDRVRDTDVDDSDAWQRIKAEFDQLRNELRS